MRDLRRLLKYLRPHWPIFSLATLATLEAWKMISILLIVFTLAKGIAEYLSTYLMARIGQSAVLKLRQDLYSHLLAQSATFFERHRTNYLVSRLVSSAAAIETAVTSTIRDMLRESFTLIAFLSASFFYSWRLTLGSLLIAPVIAVLTAKFGRALRNLARESFEGSKQLTDTAQEALAAAHHVWEVMDEHAAIPEKPGAGELALLKKEIELRNVSFGYANESRS